VTGTSVPTARFDWYAATINVAVDTLRDVLCRDLAGTAAAEEGKRHGYHNREVIRDAAGVTVATILHGGNGDIPHAFASSDHAPAFAEVIRQHWGARHRVSRMDSAIDFDGGPGTWERLYKLTGKLADGKRVKGDERSRVRKISTSQVGNWRHAPYSRTFYVGAKTSAVLLRLYEKGAKVRMDAERHGQERPDVSDHWVRAEIQVRPDGASKTTAATATPLQAFGYSEWSRELLRRLDGSEVPRVNVKERRDSDHERAMQAMVHQYRNHLLIDVANLGGWAALGEDLRRRLETGAGGPDIWGRGDDTETPF